MDKEIITLDSLLNSLKDKVGLAGALNAEVWINYANDMNILLLDEEEKLIRLEVNYYKKIDEIISTQVKENVAAAERRARASEEYYAYKLQESKCRRAEQFIMINKKKSDRAAGF